MKAIIAILACAASPALAKPITAKAPAPKKAVVEKPIAVEDRKVVFDANAVLLGDVVAAPIAAPIVVDEKLADKKAPAVDAMTTLDMGAGYGLKQNRQGALPTMHTEEFEAKSLTENQVGAIVRERSEDLEYCWLRLPPAKRVVSAAILHLEIEKSGKVAAVEVNGDMPAGVGKCISQMASRWAFPAADAPSTVDHGIMLTTASQKVR